MRLRRSEAKARQPRFGGRARVDGPGDRLPERGGGRDAVAVGLVGLARGRSAGPGPGPGGARAAPRRGCCRRSTGSRRGSRRDTGPAPPRGDGAAPAARRPRRPPRAGRGRPRRRTSRGPRGRGGSGRCGTGWPTRRRGSWTGSTVWRRPTIVRWNARSARSRSVSGQTSSRTSSLATPRSPRSSRNANRASACRLPALSPPQRSTGRPWRSTRSGPRANTVRPAARGPVEDHRGVERRRLLLDVGPVLGQPGERVQLRLLLATGAQRGADEGGGLADERVVRRPERASGVGRSPTRSSPTRPSFAVSGSRRAGGPCERRAREPLAVRADDLEGADAERLRRAARARARRRRRPAGSRGSTGPWPVAVAPGRRSAGRPRSRRGGARSCGSYTATATTSASPVNSGTSRPASSRPAASTASVIATSTARAKPPISDCQNARLATAGAKKIAAANTA